MITEYRLKFERFYLARPAPFETTEGISENNRLLNRIKPEGDGMDRVETIRKEEKKYHDFCYETFKLFEPGSWLHRPVKTVMDLLEQFENHDFLNVLDLGSGIGRNSIPIATSLNGRDGRILCVDMLESALLKLQDYSKEFGVQQFIETRLANMESFVIQPAKFDLILAVSALEHVSSEEELEKKLQEMVIGTSAKGINCIIIGSNIHEVNVETNIELDPMFEVNMSTEKMLKLLDRQYDGWEIQKRFVKPLAYDIVRNRQHVKLTTDCITYVAKNRTV